MLHFDTLPSGTLGLLKELTAHWRCDSGIAVQSISTFSRLSLSTWSPLRTP